MSTSFENSTTTKYSLLNSFPSDPAELAEYNAGHFEGLMDQLTEFDIADCLYRAAMSGNEPLMRKLVEYRGAVPVDFVHPRPTMQSTINGEPTNAVDIAQLSHIRSPAGLKSLLQAIDELGMKGLINPGPTFPALFRKLNINDSYQRIEVASFSGQLPELIEGQLRNPELALALAQESASTCTPDAYRPMLCWASESMVKQFPDSLATLRPFQNVARQGSMAQWKQGSGAEGNMLFSGITLGVKPSEGIKFAPKLMKTMAPLAPTYGFDDLEGRVLCETKSDFLLNFEVGESSLDNIAASQAFVQSYCPMDIMAMQVTDACDMAHKSVSAFMEFGGELASEHSVAYNELFNLLSNDHPLRDRALDMMTAEQWKGLFKKADSKYLYASSLIAMYQTFGLDNTGLSVKIRYDDIPAFKVANYRFSDETKFFDDEKAFKSHCSSFQGAGLTAVYAFLNSSLMLDQGDFFDASGAPKLSILEKTTLDFIDVVNLNIWPSNTIPPTDFAEAVKMAGSADLSNTMNNRSMALRAMLVVAGIDACVQAISAPRQWINITKIFPKSEVTPYLSIMPNKAKGMLLEEDLGL